MTISLYPICTARSIWSFRPQPNTSPVRVRVPKGSVLREVKTVGLLLFVPSEGDGLQLIRWNANQVMREVGGQGGRFSVIRRKRRTDTCQI